MIRSMTGFGRAEAADGERRVTVELKSVNHRYLDMNIRMPKPFGCFDAAIRNLLKGYLQRGKADVFINYEDYTGNRAVLKYNRELAGEYLRYLKEMGEAFGLENDVRVCALSRYPEVFVMEDEAMDEEAAWKFLEPALREAAENFTASREREGANLKEDLSGKLKGLEELVRRVEARSPEVTAAYREKLEGRVRELLDGASIEESRIAAEVVLFADKICSDEETVRLRSHIEGMAKALEEGGGIGRKLDFIAQEMNREANTVLSKSADLEVSNLAIELKTEIEKIREQIQNIE